jgi:hypothetical protein
MDRTRSFYQSACLGAGTWNSWFIGYYGTMLEALQPGIPIYLRFDKHDQKAKPFYLSEGESVQPKDQLKDQPFIKFSYHACFEHVY